MPKKLLTAVAAGLVYLFGGIAAVAAQQSGLNIELNKVEPAAQGCRLHFDVHNRTDMDFRVLSANLVFFDPQGVMSSQILVSFGRLHPNKHHFFTYDFPTVTCGDVSRILVNNLQQCQHNGDEAFDCISALSVSHRGPIELAK